MSRLYRRADFSLDVRTLPQSGGPVAASPVAQRMFVFRCPICAKRLRTTAGRVGLNGRCPACRHEFPIPGVGA
ncbi:MAG: hypothetical protein BIFFINMI_02094 [Phycisphaerae bacterium]|nr:hypothetical protein [Phycisphaerae bacterium]